MTGTGAGQRKLTSDFYVCFIFWILSPVWTRDNWDLETGINLEGWVRQLRQVRISTDINVEFDE